MAIEHRDVELDELDTAAECGRRQLLRGQQRRQPDRASHDRDSYWSHALTDLRKKTDKPWHLLLENRHGLVVNACAATASGTAEREAAVMLLRAAGAGNRHHARYRIIESGAVETV